MEEFQCLFAEWWEQKNLPQIIRMLFWGVGRKGEKNQRSMKSFWTDCKLQLKKNRERGPWEAISFFFFFLKKTRTIAENNSKRKGSEEMAEVAELPQTPHGKNKEGRFNWNVPN